jgi:hypothetical protein
MKVMGFDFTSAPGINPDRSKDRLKICDGRIKGESATLDLYNERSKPVVEGILVARSLKTK